MKTKRKTIIQNIGEVWSFNGGLPLLLFDFLYIYIYIIYYKYNKFILKLPFKPLLTVRLYLLISFRSLMCKSGFDGSDPRFRSDSVANGSYEFLMKYPKTCKDDRNSVR